ncbi:hypothetical protein IFM89_009118 [Coptis chinensis]|uniref:FRIGIDA-like protein n=1 Tax=Coptis chinensis TaxID=261450 RepID=A0A835HUK5_9MAGN|nr:hypothetical protein IFM89_009118 [Coptis chinensis]
MPVAGKIAKRALSVAEKWKVKIQNEEGSGGVGHVEATTFLQVVVGFGIVYKFDLEFLRKLAEGPYAVLSQQIEDETVKFAHYLGIKVVSIVGGQSIEEQGFKIRQGCEVVIATPGCIIDCLERRNLKLENEDEELDEKRIYITTYMFSATMPPAVERLARKYLRNPIVVTIGTAGKATNLITQHVIMIKDSEKWPRLQKLLNDLNRVSNPFPNFHVTVKST